MKLTEYESKKILSHVGIPHSKQTFITSSAAVPTFTTEKIAKVQVIANGRGKAGGVRAVSNTLEAISFFVEFFQKPFLGETVEAITLEDVYTIEKSFYLAFFIDTKNCNFL